MHSKKRSYGGGGIVLMPGTTVVISPHINEYYFEVLYYTAGRKKNAMYLFYHGVTWF